MADSTIRDRVYELLEQGLSAQDMMPMRQPEGIATKYPGFTLRCGATESLKNPLAKNHVFGSVEINAQIAHPELGEWSISDLVSTEATTPDEVVEKCVQTYLSVTLPPLRALFDADAFRGTTRTIASINFQGVAVSWNIYSGDLQILGDSTDELSGFLKAHFPASLIINALVPVLAETRLHWCKIYGERTKNGTTFGCAIDGKRSADATRRLKDGFSGHTSDAARWSFREFLVFVPAGVPDEKDIERLKQITDGHLETAQSPPRKSWWPFATKRTQQ